MIYKYNKNQVKFDKISNAKIGGCLLMLMVLVGLTSSIFWVQGVICGKKLEQEKKTQNITDTERIILIQEADAFTNKKLALMLNDLNVKYPHIVLAQSIIETGEWSSKIFIENHNLFGMKKATQRITTAKGTNSNHAYYNHWRESVYDYAFYQSRYLHSIKTEEQYFQYLSASYAEDSRYVEKVKKISNSNRVKDLLN